MSTTVRVESPDQPEIVAMLEHSTAFSNALYPPEHNYLLSLVALAAPNVSVYVARDDETHAALGMGALVRGTDASAVTHHPAVLTAELKRMWVPEASRGRGVSRLLLEQMESDAAAEGMRQIVLETGPKNDAALALYERDGYRHIPFFGNYHLAEASVCMAKELTAPAEPTGRQFHLTLRKTSGEDSTSSSATASASASATVTQVGAALRELTVGDIRLVPDYPIGMATPSASGVVLVPWPNRVRDGEWTQRGVTRQLSVSEPVLRNASHGLLRFATYFVVAVEEHAVTLSETVVPQTGYPFQLETSVTYALTDMGIAVTHTVTNVGAEEAPVALGTHPFVMLGETPTAELELRLPASTRFVVDDRLLPVAEVSVDGDFDLREGRRLGDLELDTAFGGLARDADGLVRHCLTAPDGRRVTLWAGPGFDYVQVYTTRTFPGQDLAVAIEPMTAPADTFNSGQGLRWLAPGETWTLHWGIELS